MLKIGFPMPTAKNRFQILNLHPKKRTFKKTWSKNEYAINQYPIYLSIFYTIQFHYDLLSLIMVDHNFKGR